MIGLPAFLKMAAGFGLDWKMLEKLALEKGLPFAEEKAREILGARALKKTAAILEGTKHAQLDGKTYTDKDGIQFSDVDYFIHEALYLSIKYSYVPKGGKIVDGFRDSHLSRVTQLVRAEAGTTYTRESLIPLIVKHDLEVLL